MSCDGNRGTYFMHLASAHGVAAQAFGGTDEAKQALEELFEIGRNGVKPPAEALQATAQTQLMFQQMRQLGIKPPTHSKRGIPKTESQFGYALVQRTITALERGEPLPPQALELFLSRQRHIQNLRPTARGHIRCGTCGQFASPIRGHVCPRTANALAFQRSLARRLGLPPSAFPESAVQTLLDTARTGPMLMIHPRTGETVQVSLDALPMAMGNGFTPEAWHTTAVQALSTTGGIYTVMGSDVTTPPQPQSALAAAAAASGLLLDPSMRVIPLPNDRQDTAGTRGLAESFAYGSDPTRAYPMRYRVLELDDLIPSNLDTGAIHPAYDAALQPRQRDRAASQVQIEKVAKTLTADALLTDFKQLDKGAPIIGHEDYCVESGNGRVLALRKAREAYPTQWKHYQERLRTVAASFGVDAAELAAMHSPVLVRERVEVVDRAAFAREANAPPVLQMSTLENAVIDAQRLRDETVLRLVVRKDQSIDLALRAKANQGFVRDFMLTLPENERAILMRADGSLNQHGIWRMKAALFTRTFPGEAGRRLAETFTEALDSTTKNFEQAVAGTLPALVRAQSLIGNGQRAAVMDLSADIALSLDMLARLREQEMPVTVYLEQSKMFERELSPFQETILRHFDTIGRSAKAIRRFLNAYAQAIEQAPHPAQEHMFGAVSLTKEQIFFQITQQEDGKHATEGLFV